MSVRSYIAIARPSHWFKNAFVLPGTVVAAILTHTAFSQFALPLLCGMLSACLTASANYVINEWLDAEFDQFHPVKKNRPVIVSKMKLSLILCEYCILAFAGLCLAACVSAGVFVSIVVILVLGLLYNVKPFRLKDKPYLDVISESANNAFRLSLGWFVVTNSLLMPSSLVAGYWSGSAFLMAVKRYAELRFIGDHETAGSYRRSFNHYTEERLLILSFFCAMCSAFFLGVFLVKHRIELLLSLPLLALLFAWYLHIGMKPNSNVQNPERLYREKGFTAYVVFLVAAVSALFFIDIPWLHVFLENVPLNGR